MQKVTFDAGVTKDPTFAEQLNGIIAEIKNEHDKAKQAAKDRGRKLKASPLLNLMNDGKFNADFILSEFPKVTNKTSTLPASQREIIGSVVFNAAKRAVLLKLANRARKIEEKANERIASEGQEKQGDQTNTEAK